MLYKDFSEVMDFESAFRVTDCVNACAGISDEALSSGVVNEMIDLLKRLDHEAAGFDFKTELQSILTKLED